MSRAYHHGALRGALLEEARGLLEEQGVDAVTLRALARRIGVSHSAPERHFSNRQALLDALSVSGFTLLTEELRQAMIEHEDALEDRFRAASRTYVRFAIENAALLDLMFASKSDGLDPAIAEAAAALFAVTAELVGDDPNDTTRGGAGPLRFVIVGWLQGTASLAAAQRIPPAELERVVDEAVSVFIPVLEQRRVPRTNGESAGVPR